jgi:hypothetical protein
MNAVPLIIQLNIVAMAGQAKRDPATQERLKRVETPSTPSRSARFWRVALVMRWKGAARRM